MSDAVWQVVSVKALLDIRAARDSSFKSWVLHDYFARMTGSNCFMTLIVAGERLSVKAIRGCLIYFLPCSSYVPVYARSTTTLGPCYQQWHHEDVLASFKQPKNCHSINERVSERAEGW